VIPYEWFEQAEARIAPHIQKTPLTRDVKRGLVIKWENHQVTGSFKPRGALNKVLSLADWERANGLVAASAGNHGQGVALAGRLTGAAVEVFVSEHAIPAKVEAMRNLGAKITLVDGGYAQAESAGREYALRQHKIFISPYNDGQVIAGQGTIGLEIMRELNEPVENWIVPTGGGGLISALGTLLQKRTPRPRLMGTHLQKRTPRPRLIGVQAAASPFTYNLFHNHTQSGIQDLPTLADGLSGAVEEGSVTIPMIEETVDDFLVVSEDEIARAMAFAWDVYHEKIEGSAAVGLAAVFTEKIKGLPSVVIITGGNVQPEVHENIVKRFAGTQWN
jgi:threonine dehydratase